MSECAGNQLAMSFGGQVAAAANVLFDTILILERELCLVFLINLDTNMKIRSMPPQVAKITKLIVSSSIC